MVRLMLLERLLQNLPQLRNVGGVRAIPYMQVSEEGSELGPNQTVQSLVSIYMCFSLSCPVTVRVYLLYSIPYPQVFAGLVPFLIVTLQLTGKPEGSSP